MNKYIQTDELQKQLDWENLMKMPRYAGGHDNQMIGLFKNSNLIAHYNEGGYDGEVATCVQLEDGRYAIYNDYYGSCSGCDAWEDADDESVKAMCINLSNSAYVFNKLIDVIEYLKSDTNGWSSWDGTAKPLLAEILKTIRLSKIQKIKTLINEKSSLYNNKK